MKTIHMGSNTSKRDPNWQEKVEEFRKAVEEYGEAEAYWNCTGRTLHFQLAQQLAEALPEYKFEIDYNYVCVASKY